MAEADVAERHTHQRKRKTQDDQFVPPNWAGSAVSLLDAKTSGQSQTRIFGNVTWRMTRVDNYF